MSAHLPSTAELKESSSKGNSPEGRALPAPNAGQPIAGADDEMGFPGGSAVRVLALELREGTRASRRGLTPRGSLECNPEIPAFPGEEY